MRKYISYYRVSTLKQGITQLGLKAQRTSVKAFLSEKDKLVAEYEETESGKKNNRLELLKAIEHCKTTNSILLIAKLDRLSRNVQFIYTLRDSNVSFVCCDMPDANSVTIGILAVLAQEERERTSLRTKKALDELRKKGVKLGSPKNLTPEARRKGTLKIIENAKENPNNKKATSLIVLLRKEKLSFRKIATKLNLDGFKTRRGKDFSASQVLILYDRYINKKEINIY
ncbi:recombinase family protein [Polaribacter glomeratus]|uniref:Resolvase n=1 Tax=Polaribacter glomeratus TaxID=102 RepID=A0A2S7WIZ3_9FLAO|nr:recombinase family protein [Polaribacter glomeratus]PQJ77578.1 resolvase [Polaribacter glomeratus]TXD67622.1 resolvase [Polaribacter glomeratus]